MSIELDVIPGSSQPIRWGDLKGLIHGTAQDRELRDVIGSVINLFDLGSKRAIREGELLSCPGYYYFEFEQRTTLLLSVESKVGGEDDVDYLDDFARNLLPDRKDSVRRVWELAGYSLTVTSNGGRASGELKLLAHIAACLASLTKGYVVVMDNGVFCQSVGIFTSRELN